MYNFHPAVMFLGDSGSMLLGYLVATLAIAGSMKSHATVALLIPILALGLPIMDTLLAILRRWSRGLPISQADREHVHHKLLAMGMSHKEAVIVLYCACLTLAAAALMIASANSWFAGLILGGLCVAVVAAVRIIGAAEVVAFLERLGERLRASSEEKREAAHKRAEFLLAHARDWQEVRKALMSYAGSAGLAAVRICSPDASGTVLVEAVVGDRAAGSVRSEVKTIALDRGGAVAVVVEGGEAASLAVPGKLIAAVRTAVENVQAREQAAAEAAGPLEGRLAAP
jgi:UDP-GlcNAc:undecaprenyl-phosphate GlcNAc-1-phosphate transferase